jgi:CRP-like cAMP-binding protein
MQLVKTPSNANLVTRNLLLNKLEPEERQRLSVFLTPVDLKQDQVLIEPDEPIRYVWFLEDAIGSTLQLLADGSSIESGLLGLEGMVGIQLWLRQRTTPQLTVIQVPGKAQRMDADVFVRVVIRTTSPLNDLVAAYTHGFLIMSGQTAACNRMHPVEQRLCRWLRMVYNRVPDRAAFPLKQEFLAAMLGVHRPTLSMAAGVLQKAGWIRYTRGNMEVLEPERLVTGACECYSIMEKQFEHMYDGSWFERDGLGNGSAAASQWRSSSQSAGTPS